MRTGFIKMEYYETYYYANIISNVLSDPFPYIRNIHEWYEDNEDEILLPAFPKWSRLHSFSAFLIESLVDEEISETVVEKLVKNSRMELWVDRALRFHGFETPGFLNWLNESGRDLGGLTQDDIADYHNEQYLSGDLENLIDHLSREVFQILFLNRKLLMIFNELLASTLSSHYDDDLPLNLEYLFERPGKLKRVAIPEWVKKAAFHRDRGMCSQCGKDISGLVMSQPDRHFDHIVPLAVGGLNDVTNIQLLCGPCNKQKSANPWPVSSLYETWY